MNRQTRQFIYYFFFNLLSLICFAHIVVSKFINGHPKWSDYLIGIIFFIFSICSQGKVLDTFKDENKS